jgi:hypothetical protein
MSTVVDLGGLGSRGFVVTGDNAGDRAGWTVSSAGDVNGDGFDDIIVGAPYGDLGSTNLGAAYVIYGRAGGFGPIDLGNLQPGQGFGIQGNSAGATSDRLTGMSVSAAGDVNGDGFDDVIVAASRGGLLGYGDAPKAYVIFGKASQAATVDLTTLASSDGFQINGAFESAYYAVFSMSVADAGDVNGDGFDDVIVGTRYGHNYTGSAYVVFGKASGFGAVNLETLGAADGFAILGAAQGDYAGASVSAAGDVNGDGFDDVIVGALGADIGGNNAGAAYVIFGKASGFTTIDLANLGATAGFVIQGDAAQDNAGVSVSTAGDVNGDGVADIIVGATRNSAGGSGAGAAYVIFGKATGLGTIDLGNLGAAGFIIQGDAAGDLAGTSVSWAGDVNHDGFDDVIVGAMSNDAGGMESGRAYVIFGKSGGFGTIDLTDLAPSSGFILSGSVPGTFVGSAVSGAGDINHDGFADLLVGVPFGSLGGTAAGQAYVVSGNVTLTDVRNDFNGDGRSDVLWRSDDGVLRDWLGQSNGGFAGNLANLNDNTGAIWQVAATGDFNGDGRDDIFWQSNAGAVTGWLGEADGGFTDNSTHFWVEAGTSWNVVGSADFNGDGYNDILWQNDDGTVRDWLGQPGGAFAGNLTYVNFNPGPGWHVAGTGDFNGDGFDDVVWHNDGWVREWLGQPTGGFVDNMSNVNIYTGFSWHVAGTGDFNSDGRDDILWQNDDGTVREWLGQPGGGFAGNPTYVNFNPGSGWHSASTGDFNGDGRDDVLWHNDGGWVREWLGQPTGGFIDNMAIVNIHTGTSWHVQDPSVHQFLDPGLGAWDY